MDIKNMKEHFLRYVGLEGGGRGGTTRDLEGKGNRESRDKKGNRIGDYDQNLPYADMKYLNKTPHFLHPGVLVSI
jgi:hypothetical protein